MPALSPDFVLLGLLEARPGHGYQLLEHFRTPECLGDIWKLSTSQLYALLKRLEHANLIDGREEDSIDAPIKTVYWLTETGRSALYTWLREPDPSPSTRHIRTEFLSRLYIAQHLSLPVEPIIKAQQNACHTQRACLEKECENLPAGVHHLSLQLRIAEMETVLGWIDERVLSFAGQQEL